MHSRSKCSSAIFMLVYVNKLANLRNPPIVFVEILLQRFCFYVDVRICFNPISFKWGGVHNWCNFERGIKVGNSPMKCMYLVEVMLLIFVPNLLKGPMAQLLYSSTYQMACGLLIEA